MRPWGSIVDRSILSRWLALRVLVSALVGFPAVQANGETSIVSGIHRFAIDGSRACVTPMQAGQAPAGSGSCASGMDRREQGYRECASRGNLREQARVFEGSERLRPRGSTAKGISKGFEGVLRRLPLLKSTRAGSLH